MIVHWKLFTSTTTETAALKVATRHFELAGVGSPSLSVEPYHKGGFLVRTRTEHTAADWSHGVVHALAMAQTTGSGWFLSGSITEELDAWSNSLTTPGIASAHMTTR